MSAAYYFVFLVLFFFACQSSSQKDNSNVIKPVALTEKHRPIFHFSPDSMWMNDPNGMVFHNNVYHLFYQYYPDSTVWGPMHWGHTISRDLVNWEDKPIALYPDENGYIFSGSAVLDRDNTSGLGTKENPPLVAIFTYHEPDLAKAGNTDAQTQGIAFSLDNGDSWEKYEGNPVLLNPGIADFRDPKVRWFPSTEKWIMTLAVRNQISFYSSPDLKNWSLESEFGWNIGAHGGVWECPDLFPIKVEGTDEEFWILIVSINPGGPNKGSATQYFVGDFDGTTFTPLDEKTRWLDYGPDDYAGITWSNTGERLIFIGWMSNWNYAQVVPTEGWRSAMTIPRELSLRKFNGELVLCSMPVVEFDLLRKQQFKVPEVQVDGRTDLSSVLGIADDTYELDLQFDSNSNLSIELYNDTSDKLLVHYNAESGDFSIDRSAAGETSFHGEFSDLITAPRTSTDKMVNVKLVVDVASIELFADEGSTVLTAIYFPEEVMDRIALNSTGPIMVKNIELNQIL